MVQGHVTSDDAEASDGVFVVPMSFAQQRLWFLDQMAPGNPFYNIPLAIPMDGVIDVGVLEDAINEIVRRHESLRTRFRIVNGEPSQIVRPRAHLDVTHHRLDHLPAADRRSEVDRATLAEARLPFSLEADALIRATLVSTTEREHVLLLTIHHIVADGWSIGILMSELTTLYRAFIAGQPSPLAELRLHYPDFSVWQREQLSGDRFEAHMVYWRAKLADLPALELPTDRPRPRVLDYSGASVPVELPAELTDELRTIARSEGATHFMALMAVFACLIHRYTAQDDIVLGTPIANRNHADTEPIIGFFVNSLVFRCDLFGAPSFREVLRRVRDECLDAYAHQDVPFERIVEELSPERDLSRNPLFQVTFQLVNTPTSDGIQGSDGGQRVQRGSSIFDLAFTLIESSAGPVRGIIEFSTQLFDSETISRFAAHYRNLLAGVVRQPDAVISEISIVTPAEHDLLTRQSTPVPEPPIRVLDAVRRIVEHIPNDSAVVADDQHLTFAELDAWVGRLTAALVNHGVGPGDSVAVMAEGTSLPIAMLASMRVGAAYLPLDVQQPAVRLCFMLDEARPSVIVASESTCATLPDSTVPVIVADALPIDGASVVEHCSVAPADAAYVLYTSGSAGVPKGVVIPRSALDNHMAWMLRTFPLDPSDRVLQRTASVFDASVWEFWAPLMSGARQVLLGADARRDPSEIASMVQHHQITVLQVVPSLLRALLDEPDFVMSTSLRIVFSGGEPLTSELRDQFAATFDIPLVNLYGPTESTIDATWHECSVATGTTVPIGRPISGTGAVVLDANGLPTPIGVPGRLHLSGAGLASGYLRRPRLTAERFRPDPFGDTSGGRLYDTGDIARFRTDGNLETLGRSDHQVKVRGFRVELGEVEHALQSFPGVQRAACRVHDGSMIGFVQPATSGDVVREAEHEVLDRWEDVYGQIYGELSDERPVDLNTTGWISSFDGQQIDDAAMAEWRTQTVDRILALGARSVLEVGCGTGLIMAPVAPTTDRYVGTDMSASALEYLRRQLDGADPPLASVEFAHRSAHELTDFVGQEFDLVVLNSVVQYFPSARYLREVLATAARCLAPGGSIFVGDVRSLTTLELFHTAVELAAADPTGRAHDVHQRVDDRVGQEEELVLAPAFFSDVVGELDGLVDCEISLKRTSIDTEMSLFRYDVVLRSGPAPDPQLSAPVINWRRDNLGIDVLDHRLAATEESVVVQAIPDGDLAGLRAVRAACEDPLSSLTVDGLRELVHTARSGVTAAALRSLAERHRLHVDVRPSNSGDPGEIDAVFTPIGSAHPSVLREPVARASATHNDPEIGSIAARLLPQLRARLDETLPAYMSPTRIAVLASFPCLPSGKIDRRALPVPTERTIIRVTPYVAPVDELETTLAAAWSDVTGIAEIGTHDDFFRDLAGHSILAARLAARLRSIVNTDVPLQLVFDASTIATMAEALRHNGIDREAELNTAPREEVLAHHGND